MDVLVDLTCGACGEEGRVVVPARTCPEGHLECSVVDPTSSLFRGWVGSHVMPAVCIVGFVVGA